MLTILSKIKQQETLCNALLPRDEPRFEGGAEVHPIPFESNQVD
jgi:hypothetical protein